MSDNKVDTNEKKITTIEETIETTGFTIMTVVGDSMMPLLRQGIDTVKIVPAPKKLKKYDVPLYKKPSGQYVLHRIVKVNEDGYMTCGDNRFFYEFVPFDWVIGVADKFYIGEKEVSTEDPDYKKYVKEVRRAFWPRKILRKAKKSFSK